MTTSTPCAPWVALQLPQLGEQLQLEPDRSLAYLDFVEVRPDRTTPRG